MATVAAMEVEIVAGASVPNPFAELATLINEREAEIAAKEAQSSGFEGGQNGTVQMLVNGQTVELEYSPLQFKMMPAGNHTHHYGGGYLSAGAAQGKVYSAPFNWPAGPYVTADWPHAVLLSEQGYQEPAETQPITPESVWQAYAATGMEPVNHAWWRQWLPGDRQGACGLMALALHAVGYRRDEWPGVSGHQFLTQYLLEHPTTRLTDLVPVRLAYAQGFVHGYDGGMLSPHSIKPHWLTEDMGEYQRGHDAGRAAWKYVKAAKLKAVDPDAKPLKGDVAVCGPSSIEWVDEAAPESFTVLAEAAPAVATIFDGFQEAIDLLRGQPTVKVLGWTPATSLLPPPPLGGPVAAKLAEQGWLVPEMVPG